MQKDIATIRIACNNKIPAVSTDDRTTFLELLEKQHAKFDKISQSVITCSNQTAGCNVLVNNISSPVKKSKHKRKKRRNPKTESSSSSDSSDSSELSTSANTSDSDYENNFDRRKHTRSRSSSDKRKSGKSKKKNSHRKSRREDVSKSHALYDVDKSDNTSPNIVHMWQNQPPHHFLHQPNEIPHAAIALQHPMAINMPQEQFVPLPIIPNVNFIPQQQLPNNQFQENKEQGHNLTLEDLADAAGNLQH